MPEIERGNVWRTLSHAGHNGYFVWEVREAVGEIEDNHPFISRFEKTLDGGYFLLSCMHFFSPDNALEYLHDEAAWERLFVV